MAEATSDLVAEAVKAKGEAASPEDRHYVIANFDALKDKAFPCWVYVSLPEVIQEAETDNRMLVGYPVAVVHLVNDKARLASAWGMGEVRRPMQQALHTTRYAGLAVEDVEIDEDPGIPIPTPDDSGGIDSTGFKLTLSILGDRTTEVES